MAVKGGDIRPAAHGAAGARTAAAGGVARGQARRRPALGGLPSAARPAQAGNRVGPVAEHQDTGGRGGARICADRPFCAGCHPAPAGDHEDFVMLRRACRAMGTEVELLLDAEPSAESEVAFAHAEREFERLEALLSRFRSDSQLSALNRFGALDAGPDL